MLERVRFTPPEIGFLKTLFDRGARRAAGALPDPGERQSQLDLLDDPDGLLRIHATGLATVAGTTLGRG